VPPALQPAPPEPAAPDEDALDLLRELGLAPETAPTAETPPEEPAAAIGPVEIGPGAWEAPPVRGAGDGAVAAPPAAPVAAARPRRRRRSNQLIAVGLLAMVAGAAVIGGLHYLSTRQVGNEAERYDKALKEYAALNYADAAARFRSLEGDFPESASRAAYRFYAAFSDLLEAASSQTDPAEIVRTFERIVAFAKEHQEDKLLAKHRGDLHTGLHKLARELLAPGKAQANPELVEAARQVYAEAEKYRPASGPGGRDLLPEFAEADKTVAARQRREGLLAYLHKRLARPTAPGVREARELAAELKLAADPDVKALLEKLPAAHLAAVRYTPLRSGPGEHRPAEDTEPSLLVAAPLEHHRGKSWPRRRPVLALARGVLYALAPQDGRVLWARRVGGETAPPLWLEPTEVAPECILLVSSDGHVLSALDGETGRPRWWRQLGGACVSPPALLGGRVFVPTAGGRLEEVELHGGSLLGYYDLGQPLTAGAARHPARTVLYVPADSYAVYALDVAKRSCVGVLYTGHAGGALLGPPLVLPAPPAGTKAGGPEAHLLLAQADGLEAMTLRTLPLPAGTPEVPPLRLRGWTWFVPYADGERLAVATDAGEFVLAGAGDGAALGGEMRVPLGAAPAPGGPRSRAQLAHAEGNEFWVVAGGGLHRLRETFLRATGPRLPERSAELLGVGSPLQAAQVRDDERGRPVLYFAAQSADGNACLVTAVDAHSNEVQWKRQVGLVCRGQPVPLGAGAVAEDLTGSLFVFQPDKDQEMPGGPWRASGRLLAAEGSGPAHLLAAAGGRVVAVAEARRKGGVVLTARDVAPGREPEAPRELAESGLAGTPAVVGEALVVPLRTGKLLRQPLGDGGATPDPPNWRAPHADEDARGHVVALTAHEFVSTDGSRGLARYHADGKGWERKAAAELPERVVSPPVAVPRDGGEPRVCVADTSGALTLLGADDLRPVRTWRPAGRITAGPFVRGGGVGCVLDGRKLVWFDPGRDGQLWEADFRADIVGEPALIGCLLVVADQRGRVVGLEPRTGKEVGPGYQIQSHAAPVAAPIPYGADRLFVPLTDGTVLLVGQSRLRHPLSGFPLLR
jgi:hypothetical protein